jgi:hypothetical protein
MSINQDVLKEFVSEEHMVLDITEIDETFFVLDVSSDLNVTQKMILQFDGGVLLISGQVCGIDEASPGDALMAMLNVGTVFGLRILGEEGPFCISHCLVLEDAGKADLRFAILSLAVATGDVRKELGIGGMFMGMMD